MAMDSIKLFEQFVIEKARLPLSLTLSTAVLQLRKYLSQSIKTSQECLLQTWKELQAAKKSFKSITENKEKIEKNGKYTETVTKYKVQRKKLGKTVQMCNNCQVTCCQVCEWPQNSTQSRCTYFNSTDACPKCSGRCPRSAHIRTDEQITRTSYQVEETVDYKKKMHDEGISGAQLFISVLQKSIQKIDRLSSKVWQLSIDIKQNLKLLEEKALKPKLFTDKEFYEQMIIQQEQDREDGWSDRVEALREIIKKMEALEKISKSMKLQDLFPDLKSLKDSYMDVEKRKNNSNCSIF